MTISGTTATFSAALSDNVGIGDVLQYNSGGNKVAVVHVRTSSTVYSVKDKNGGTPTAAPALTTVQVLPSISPNVSVLSSRPDDDPLRDFLASFDRLDACGADTLVLPSHGRPFVGLQPRTADLRRHHHEQMDVLRRFCGEPRTAAEALPVLFGRTLRGFHRMLALGEAVAHLHYLLAAGELERTVDAGGVVRFHVT